MTDADQIMKIQSILGKASKSKSKSKTTTKGSDRHIWTLGEEELALSLYLKKANEVEIEEVVNNTALKLSSMKMKLQNIAFIDTGIGLENVSSLTRHVFESHKNSLRS